MKTKTMKKKTAAYVPKEQLGVGCADIGPTEKKYVMDTLNRQRLSYGPYSAKFEKQFAAIHGCEYAIFCNSGTSALQVALACLKEFHDWKDGDEVLVPALTFIATSNIVLQNNMKPVFVDADRRSYNMNPAEIEKHITPKTRAIIVAHLFGQPCDMDPILDIARRHNLKIIEDSCETMFVSYKGKPVGSMGDIACFSTYMAHLIVTGVGGLAVTKNAEYAVALKSLMNHGRDSIYVSIDDDKNKTGEQLLKVVEGRFRFVRVGYSYRATEMEAALGVAQLERHKQIVSSRRSNAHWLNEQLKPVADVLQLPSESEGVGHAHMMYPIVVNSDQFTKEDLVFFLEKNKVETRDMLPLLNQPIYKKIFGDIEKNYPVAAWVNRNGFYIGCHQQLTKVQLTYMAGKIKEFVNERLSKGAAS